MISVLKEYITQFIRLSDIEFQAFADVLEPRTLKKKDHLIQTNKVCHKVYFFNNGYFRFYHFNNAGSEITSDFYFAPGFITSYTSFLTGNPSFVNVQAMDDMDVLEIKKSDLYNLYSQYPNIERVGRLIAESVAITSEQHLFMLLNQTAEDRYKKLLEQHPQFVQTIPLQYIASYLGITQETLSRIRKAIH
jgi:CRP-like cAMP-binding protein